MFVINNNQIREFDINKARQFVDYWGRPHTFASVKCYDSDKEINYTEELNVGNRLTEQNIKRLLHWKYPRMLTEKILSGPDEGKENKRVLKVLERRDDINKFRESSIGTGIDDFKRVTKEIFPVGFVWPIFLFHIARPHEFPIADRNVFKSYSLHRQVKIPENWIEYEDYIDYFFQIAIAANIVNEKLQGNEPNLVEIVKELKMVDNALVAFGQFMYSYAKTNPI
jgi:hypothetical protein